MKAFACIDIIFKLKNIWFTAQVRSMFWAYIQYKYHGVHANRKNGIIGNTYRWGSEYKNYFRSLLRTNGGNPNIKKWIFDEPSLLWTFDFSLITMIFHFFPVEKIYLSARNWIRTGLKNKNKTGDCCRCRKKWHNAMGKIANLMHSYAIFNKLPCNKRPCIK